MFKTLIYGSLKYKNFEINEDGYVKNRKTNTIYKNRLSKDGYVVCSLPLGRRGSVKIIRVHKALAETFIDNPNNYPCVHHKNEDKSDCSLSNLEWVTYEMNTSYYLKEHPNASKRKLDKETITWIKENYPFYSLREIKKLTSVNSSTVLGIVKGEIYKDMM